MSYDDEGFRCGKLQRKLNKDGFLALASAVESHQEVSGDQRAALRDILRLMDDAHARGLKEAAELLTVFAADRDCWPGDDPAANAMRRTADKLRARAEDSDSPQRREKLSKV